MPGPGLAGRNRTNQRARDPDYGQISEWLQFALQARLSVSHHTLCVESAAEQTRQSVTVYGYCCVFPRAAVNINDWPFPPPATNCIHCGWAQFASFAVRSVWPAATARRRRDAVDVVVEVAAWLCTCQFLCAALALRSGLPKATPFPWASLVGGLRSDYLFLGLQASLPPHPRRCGSVNPLTAGARVSNSMLRPKKSQIFMCSVEAPKMPRTRAGLAGSAGVAQASLAPPPDAVGRTI